MQEHTPEFKKLSSGILQTIFGFEYLIEGLSGEIASVRAFFPKGARDRAIRAGWKEPGWIHGPVRKSIISNAFQQIIDKSNIESRPWPTHNKGKENSNESPSPLPSVHCLEF